MVINVPIFIHGMVLGQTQPHEEMQALADAVRAKVAPALASSAGAYDGDVVVRWGYDDGIAPGRDDERLARVQDTVNALTRYAAVKQDAHQNNMLRKLGPPLSWIAWPIRRLRAITIFRVRETVVLTGFGDVAYYCAPEGEAHLRAVVYGRILAALQPHWASGEEVRLHVVGHSIGVTIAHDLLFGLLNPNSAYVPDFLSQTIDPDDVHPALPVVAKLRFAAWRNRALQNPPLLTLGSFHTAASQIPVTLFRKQVLVNRLDNSLLLEAQKIGVRAGDGVQWQDFHDIDDVVAFATRPLYDRPDEIREVEVEASRSPTSAHTSYWKSDKVIDSIAELIAARC